MGKMVFYDDELSINPLLINDLIIALRENDEKCHPLSIQIKHEAYSFLILCSHIFMKRGQELFVLLISWLIKMTECSFLSVYTTNVITNNVSLKQLFSCCRWATRMQGLWSSWWTNTASTTSSKSTLDSRLNTRSPKKSQSK